MDNQQIFTEDELVQILHWTGFSNKRRPRGGVVHGCCPIHSGADNPNGFTAYLSSGKHGVFVCWTRGCLANGAHQGGDVFDLVSAVLDNELAEQHGILRENLIEKTPFGQAKEKIEEIIGRRIEEFRNVSVGYHDYIKAQVTKLVAQHTVEMRVLAEGLLEEYRHFHPYLLNRGYTREILKEFEIGYDPKTERITFPMRDLDGNIIAFARRVVDDSKITKLNPKYKTDSFTKGDFLYNLHRVKKLMLSDPGGLTKLIHPGIIIVEGQLDVMRMHQHGFPLTVAVGGSVLTEHQAMLLESLTEQITVIADSDKAGTKFLKSVKEVCGKYITVYKAELPPPYNDVGQVMGEHAADLLHYVLEGRKRL